MAEPVPENLAFFQYAFSKDEFINRLEAAGFRVEETIGYSLLWGLMEIPGMARVVRASERALGNRGRRAAGNGTAGNVAAAEGNGTPPPDASGRSSAAGIKPKLRAVVDRILFQEDTTIPVAGPALALMLEHCSNLRMYVARPR